MKTVKTVSLVLVLSLAGLGCSDPCANYLDCCNELSKIDCTAAKDRAACEGKVQDTKVYCQQTTRPEWATCEKNIPAVFNALDGIAKLGADVTKAKAACVVKK